MRVALVVLAQLSATAAGAQQPGGAEVEALRARVSELQVVAEEARVREATALSRLNSLPGDSVRIDSILIVGHGGDPRVLAAGARLAAEELRRIAGDESHIWIPDTIVLSFGRSPSQAARPGSVEMEAGSDASAVARTIIWRLRGSFSRRAGASLRGWAAFPLDADSVALLRRAHAELVSAAPGAATRCALGSIGDCTLALGLRSPPDAATALWDSVGRYETVRRLGRTALRELDALRNQCLGERMDVACATFIRSLYGSGGSTTGMGPLGHSSREALLLIAVKRGGPAALRRLHQADTMPLAAIIEGAAGQPLDSVVQAWHTAVMSARPRTDIARQSHLGAAIWSIVLAVTALGGALWRAG
jgi:hypothetical protein